MAYSAILRRCRAVRSLIPGYGRESRGEESKVVGWGRGWVAMFNKRSNHLFLSDPISHRITDLPLIDTLPNPGITRNVSKVVLSSSPEDGECRAMMMFGPTNRLAFCVPGHSSEWTPIGDPFFDSADFSSPFERYARVQEDLVYCTRRKVFTTITAGSLNPRDFFFAHPFTRFAAEICHLDIQDPNSPKIVRSDWPPQTRLGQEGKTVVWGEENHELLEKECIQTLHLVYAEQSDQLFVVVRYVQLVDGLGRPLGFVPRRKDDGGLHGGPLLGKTYGFIVMELMDCIEKDKRWSRECNRYHEMDVVDDLNGMAMFVGVNNHSFAIPIHDRHYQQLFNPNSIYFTDAKRIKTRVSVVNDTGVFDYATKTVSPISPSSLACSTQCLMTLL
ncbi:hypothetical protein OROMI_005145 [Orobanche minor]